MTSRLREVSRGGRAWADGRLWAGLGRLSVGKPTSNILLYNSHHPLHYSVRSRTTSSTPIHPYWVTARKVD